MLLMIGKRCLKIQMLSIPDNKVYWTSRKVGGFFSKVESGWTYKYKNKEYRIYETRAEAEYALLMKMLLKSGKLDGKGYKV